MTKFKAKILAVAAALGIGIAAAYAQGPAGGSPGMGPGMMGDHGYGRGGGMMGRGYGMGPGMMGGGYDCGMGAGMMGGGMGHGFAGAATLSSLDLSDAQRNQVLSIQDRLRKINWDLMGKMQDEMAKQRDAFADGKRDRAAITAANKRMFELRQQMLDNSFDAAEKVEKILTPQQREQLKKQWGPGWMMGY